MVLGSVRQPRCKHTGSTNYDRTQPQVSLQRLHTRTLCIHVHCRPYEECQFYFDDNFNKSRATLSIHLLLHSEMTYRVRETQMHHHNSDLLTTLPCSIADRILHSRCNRFKPYFQFSLQVILQFRRQQQKNYNKKLSYCRDSTRCTKQPFNVTQGQLLLCQSMWHI